MTRPIKTQGQDAGDQGQSRTEDGDPSQGTQGFNKKKVYIMSLEDTKRKSDQKPQRAIG